MIESLIQSIRHITGMCGESHPSILLGGIAMMSYGIGLIRRLKERMLPRKDLLNRTPERHRFPYLPDQNEEIDKF
jgi:hypothetical protein